ncbi:MAG: discoidin domain-containing protein [Oscillospiraceae bacterium]|jgi:hypothetical protein|nr:discoidin domain-containing protein [Oscillospiraceae bacterium]
MKTFRKSLAWLLALLLMLSALALPAAAAPSAGYTWGKKQALPTFPAPAATLDAIDVRGLDFPTELLIGSLQGIVNRTQPRIFNSDGDFDSRDAWGTDLALNLAYLPWQDAVAKYLGELSGIVITNPDVVDSNNVATTIAGVTSSLIASPTLAALLTSAPYNLPVTVDLRTVGISDKLSAYRYLYDHYWGDCTRRTISGLAPDGHSPMRDLAVAVNSAVLWLDAGVPAERDILKLFFKDSTPLETFYTGWWPDEPKGIDFASAYGVMTVASDFYRNYTVYAGQSRQLTIPAVPAKPALDNSKIYVAVYISDGDNIQYDQGAMRVERLWGDAARGSVPVGWTFSPLMLDAGPQVLNWYYQTATPNDVLVCGPSGAGYSTSFQWPNEKFIQNYGAMTNDYFEKTGINIITVWHELTGPRADSYTAAMPSVLGLTTQGLSGLRIRHTASDVPVLWLGSDSLPNLAGLSYESGMGNFERVLTDVANKSQSKAQFYAAQGDVWHTSYSDFVQLKDNLDQAYPGRFEFVRPDHFFMLLNEASGKPYAASLQQAATASSGADTANAVDGTISTGWTAATSGEAWLEVDLGEDYKLDRYVLKNAETNYLDATFNSKAWQLQVRTDGGDWRTIDRVQGNSAAIAYRDLSNQSARYVRVLITDPGADGIARVQELELFGIKASDATPEKRVGVWLQDAWQQFVNFFFLIYDWLKRLVTGIFG